VAARLVATAPAWFLQGGSTFDYLGLVAALVQRWKAAMVGKRLRAVVRRARFGCGSARRG
jgi:hypothetical protein